jgi:hypothetical protein
MAKKQRPRQKRMLKTVKEQPAKRNIPIWAWLAIGGSLTVLLIIGLFYIGTLGAANANVNIEGVEVLPDPGRSHVNGDIDYAQVVPAGGPHNPTWLNCGIYDEPVRTENVVHSMEHGAVWIAYQPDLPPDQVEILRDLVRQEQRSRGERMIVLAPKPDLEAPLVLTAWRVQLRVDDASDERIVQFVEQYQRGPFTPEPGADCTFSGTGQPLN